MISFYIMGFVDLVGVATGYVQKDFALSDSIAQLLPSMVFIWFALISLPTGIFQDRRGKKITVSIGIFITGIGLLIPFLMYTYPAVVLGFSLLGIGNTILQVSANPLLIDISTKNTQSANLSFSQFVKASAALLSPIFIAILVRVFGDWKLIFPVYAIISIVIALWLLSIKIDEKSSSKPPATFGSIITLFKKKTVVVLVVGIFLIVGFDVGMNSNIALFLKSRFGLDLETAGFGISVYFGALMTGRFLGGVLLRYISERNFIIASLTLTFIGLAGIIFITNIEAIWVMIFIAGLGFSNIFPLLFSIAIDRMPDYANEVSGLIILAVSGGAVIPPIMGYVNQTLGSIAPILVLVACMLYVAYATLFILGQKPQETED